MCLVFLLILIGFVGKCHGRVQRRLFMTYGNVSHIPSKVFDNVRLFAPDYNLTIYNDSAAVDFLNEKFGAQVSETFRKLRAGAHKADLLRFCLLYAFGGVYLDVKTILLAPLHEVFPDGFISAVFGVFPGHMHIGVLAAPPHQRFLLRMIRIVVRDWKILNDQFYAHLCKSFFDMIAREIGHIPNDGVNRGRTTDFFLLREKHMPAHYCIDGLDRYGLCVAISMGNRTVLRSRYADYPW